MGGILLFLFKSPILIVSENYITLFHFEFCQLKSWSPRHKKQSLAVLAWQMFPPVQPQQ